MGKNSSNRKIVESDKIDNFKLVWVRDLPSVVLNHITIVDENV
jgi:hypothetical protein